jgi:hypothetical protein
MAERFVWAGNMRFVGTAEEFNRLAGVLAEMPVQFEIPEWIGRKPHLAGCNPIGLDDLIGQPIITKLIEGMPRLQIKYIKDIAGGIRDPHLHLKGEVVMLDRERFRVFVGEAAKTLAMRRADMVQDYIGVMDPIGRLGQ